MATAQNACNEHPEGCPENSHRGHRYDKSQATPTGKAIAAMIADLQRQLREAQETLSHVNEAYDSVKAERDRAWHWCAATNERSMKVLEDANKLRVERDAAIERGKLASGWLRHHFVRAVKEHKRAIVAERDSRILQSNLEGMYHHAVFQYGKRKAAERDAEAKGALLGRFAARCREIAAKDCGYWSEEYNDDEGVALLAEADHLAPTEALSPQGGQEEGDQPDQPGQPDEPG